MLPRPSRFAPTAIAVRWRWTFAVANDGDRVGRMRGKTIVVRGCAGPQWYICSAVLFAVAVAVAVKKHPQCL